MQIRVFEDLRLLLLLERISTTIQVREANLKLVLVWFTNLSLE